jgi:type I restriction enzyme R subunit
MTSARSMAHGHKATRCFASFLFATNGRPYVKQLATKSGIWFWNARTGETPKPLADWFSPRDLQERLQQTVGDPAAIAGERELGVSGLRPYQVDAIGAVVDAIGAGQANILLSMATGTGKTRLAIALMYELLRAKRFRRILFLVDRNALGRQTIDAMATTDTQGFQVQRRVQRGRSGHQVSRGFHARSGGDGAGHGTPPV